MNERREHFCVMILYDFRGLTFNESVVRLQKVFLGGAPSRMSVFKW